MRLFIATTKDRSQVIMVQCEDEEQARIMARNETKISPEEFDIHPIQVILDGKAPFQAIKLDKRLKSTKMLLALIDKRISLTDDIIKINREIDDLNLGI